MIKISEKQKEEIVEAGIRMVSYLAVAGIGWKLNNMRVEREVERNSKIAELELDLLEMKKSRIRCEIAELKDK